MVCPICGKLIAGRSVPYTAEDVRYPSGKVMRVYRAHPACVPGDEPETTDAAA